MSFTIQGIRISDNLKTGYSLNVDRAWCQPTRWCRSCCYGREVSKEQAKLEGIHTNKGPIAWKAAQRCYTMNRLRLSLMSEEQRLSFGRTLAARLLNRGYDNLRICGMGDLGLPLIHVCLGLMEGQVRPWGFSKRADMLALLDIKTSQMGLELGDPQYPCFTGSVDSSMTLDRINALIVVTRHLMGEPRLAYVTQEPGWVGAAEIDALPFKSYLKVVFGYHTASHKTEVAHGLACPATNGVKDVHCQTCRRCLT